MLPRPVSLPHASATTPRPALSGRAGGWLLAALLLLAVLPATGCLGPMSSQGKLELVWGRKGIGEGRLQKPRAMTIDENDRLFIVDITGRIQVFDRDGQYLYGWRTPMSEMGKPCGLGFDNDGNLMVGDTHYHRVLFYTQKGEPLEEKTIGGVQGPGPGEFGFVTDAVQDSAGNYYVAEYGEYARIQKFSPSGEPIMQWGGRGPEPGQFRRPQGITIDEEDHIWVADACNHRIQVFDVSGDEARLIRIWGEEGSEPGQLRYPYGLALDGEGHVYVSEFGNHRVQKFTLEGESLACWGGPGREEGQLNSPWALVLDSRGRLHVLDTYNHRVQRVRM